MDCSSRACRPFWLALAIFPWVSACAIEAPRIKPGTAISTAPSEAVLNRKVKNPDELTDILYQSWPEKIGSVCKHEGFVCGIEETASDPINQLIQNPFENHGEYTHLDLTGLHGTSVTIRYVLDNIMKTHPNYRWQFSDGVLNIIPIPEKRYQNNGRAVLENKLARFDVVNGYAGRAIEDVVEKVGINPPFDQKKIPTQISIEGPGLPLTKKITLHLKDVSLRQIFNAAAKADGQFMWEFYFGKYPFYPDQRFMVDEESWNPPPEYILPQKKDHGK